MPACVCRFVAEQFHSHDDIAELLGVPAKSFNEIYTDLAEDIQRSVLEYVNKLRAAKSPGAGGNAAHAGSEDNAGAGPISIEIDPNRFPIAPCPASLKNVTKEQLEKLYRSYMTQHYRMCSPFMLVL